MAETKLAPDNVVRQRAEVPTAADDTGAQLARSSLSPRPTVDTPVKSQVIPTTSPPAVADPREVQRLVTAMKGWGTDEDELVSVLKGKTRREVEALAKLCKEETGSDMYDDITGRKGVACKSKEKSADRQSAY